MVIFDIYDCYPDLDHYANYYPLYSGLYHRKLIRRTPKYKYNSMYLPFLFELTVNTVDMAYAKVFVKFHISNTMKQELAKYLESESITEEFVYPH